MILTDSEVASLKSALACWELAGYVFTGIVGFGCVGEYLAEFTSLPKKCFPKIEKAGHKLARLSLIILIFGIAGELLSAVRTSRLSDQIIANVEQKAEEANGRAAANEKEAGQLRKDAEGERLARVKLQKELQPRRLTGKQRKELAALLGDKQPELMTVGLCAFDTECIDFADDIEAALKDAKWTPTFVPRMSSKYGIEVGCLKRSDSPLMEYWIKKMRDALSEIGFPSRKTWFDPSDVGIPGGFKPNVLYLVIGKEPVPPNSP